MKSYFLNGGYIGPTVDLSDTAQHIMGTTTARLRPTYVGGTTASGVGVTTNITVSLASIAGIQQNDLVIVALSIGAVTDKSYRISGYTQIADLYSNDTFDANLQVGYKFMGATPDTSVTITGGTGPTVVTDAYAIAIHVWRGIDTTTPLDVTTTTTTAIDTGIPNPPAITPTTANSVVLVAAGTGHNGGTDTYTATELSNFLTVGGNDDNDATVGMGSFAWVSGTFDPVAWTWSQTSNTSFATASCSVALRPKLSDVPVYGNYKNSGMWNLIAQYDDRFYNYAPPGGVSYVNSAPGTYYFVVPPGVTEISAVVIGGGGGGAGGETGRDQGVNGGAGGGLAYGTFVVTPNEILTVVIGSGGTGGGTGTDGTAGTATTISRGATVLLSGGGGARGLERTTATVTGGASTGTERDGGGAGGNSGGNSADTGSGGGGAGGYSAAGGAGGTTGAGSSSTGGGGGGGGATNSGQGYGGGGTGPYGAGTNGTGGALNTVGASTGGSGGANGTRPNGGYPGGGGGGCDDDTNGSGGNGANGTAYIIWGQGRSYPNNTGL
jgi:hypothetical protein